MTLIEIALAGEEVNASIRHRLALGADAVEGPAGEGSLVAGHADHEVRVVDVAVGVEEGGHPTPQLSGTVEGGACIVGTDRCVVRTIGGEVADDGLDIVGVPSVEECAKTIGGHHGAESSVGRSALATFASEFYRGATMKTRIALLLGLALAITPASVAAQAGPTSDAIDRSLIDQLCAASAADQAELDACAEAVEGALTKMLDDLPAERLGLLEQAQSLLDETIDRIREIDLEAAIDEVVASAQTFELDIDIDVQQAIDDTVAAVQDLDLELDIDVQAAIDGAVAEALAATEDFDLQAAVDAALADALAAVDDADLQGTVDDAVLALEGSVDEARAVVAEAQQWAQVNKDAVCRGGSVSLGTTVGVAVFVLTGVEWLGLQAFWATERFTNATCGDIVE